MGPQPLFYTITHIGDTPSCKGGNFSYIFKSPAPKGHCYLRYKIAIATSKYSIGGPTKWSFIVCIFLGASARFVCTCILCHLQGRLGANVPRSSSSAALALIKEMCLDAFAPLSSDVGRPILLWQVPPIPGQPHHSLVSYETMLETIWRKGKIIPPSKKKRYQIKRYINNFKKPRPRDTPYVTLPEEKTLVLSNSPSTYIHAYNEYGIIRESPLGIFRSS